MVHEILSPGMKDGGKAQFSAETLMSELEERGAGTLKKQIVNRLGVLKSQRTEFGRECEHPMEIAHGQERSPLAFQPQAAVLVLAGGTMAIAAAIGPPMRTLAVLTVPDRPTQLSGATTGEPAQYFELMRGHRAALEVFGQERLQNPGQCQLRRLAGGTAHRSSRSDLRSSSPSGLWICARRSARTCR